MDVRDLINILGDGEYHSGEELGERFGVSRTAIWKQLKKLEAFGITLDAIRGRGYRLDPPIELLDGGEIVRSLPLEARRRLARLFVEMQIPSTNPWLLERFRQGAGHGEVCFAESQSAGRGRRGRSYQAALGSGLTFSVGWRFESAASTLEGLSLATGVAIAEALAEYGVKIELKWPNDPVQRREDGHLEKIGGILVELQGDAEGPCDVVVGIGLNVTGAPPIESGSGLPAGFIQQQSSTLFSRNRLAASLVNHVEGMLALFSEQGFAGWQARWNALNALKGQRIMVYRGNESFAAIAGDADVHGSLEVEAESGIKKVSGGEVTLRPIGA